MRFLSAIIDALAAFVQRNPLMVLLLFVLALFAPALVKGIAVFILYALMGIVLAAFLLAVLLRWRIRRVRRDMEEQFRGFRSGDDPFSGMSSDPFSGGRRASREGDVKVHRTPDAPGKRVASDVGDYVEFEETGKR